MKICRKIFGFATILLAGILAISAWGAEKSMPRAVTPPLPESMKRPVAKPPAGNPNLPDLVFTSIKKLGDVEINANKEQQLGVEFTIKNKGLSPTGRSFSVGVTHQPECREPDCIPPPMIKDDEARSLWTLQCKVLFSEMPRSFKFSPPIKIDAPLAAGETRTMIGRLILPECLSCSSNGNAASVRLKVDDMHNIGETNEKNNESDPISAAWKK